MTKHTLERLGPQHWHERSVLLPQAGVKNEGRSLALDMEHDSNAGASLDESLLVSVLRSKFTFWKVLHKMVEFRKFSIAKQYLIIKA